MCELIPSGFADEAAIDKTADQQFSAFAALGFRYLSLRFIDVGFGIKNMVDLSTSELDLVRRKLDQYDLQVSSIGSPIGKTKLLDRDDGTDNDFHPFQQYLEINVEHVCQIAKKLNCKCIRGFSFYHPRGTLPGDHVAQAADNLKQIASVCDAHGLTFGLEVEANLIGQNSSLLNEIISIVNHDAMVLIFDGANLVTQGYSQSECVGQFKEMLPFLGWIHVKDHVANQAAAGEYIDEESLCGFVPAGEGMSGYPEILSEFKLQFSMIAERAMRRGLPGVFADLEPHLKGGGQFGGFSGPDGFGIAARAFHRLCQDAEINFPLRQFDSTFSPTH